MNRGIPRAVSFRVESEDILLPLDNGRTLVIDSKTIVGDYDLDDIELIDHGVCVRVGLRRYLSIEACLECAYIPSDGCSLR